METSRILEVQVKERKFFQKKYVKEKAIFLCYSDKNSILHSVDASVNKINLNLTTKSVYKFLKNLNTIYKLIINEKINIIHSHHRNDTIYACVLKILLKNKITLVYTVHGPQVANKEIRIFYKLLNYIFIFLSNKYIDHIIYISNFTKKKTQHLFKKVINQQVIYNGTPEPSVAADENISIKEFQVNKNMFIVTMAGGISGYKNPKKFVKIAKRLKQYDKILFLSIGDGEEKEELINYSKKHKLKNIIFIPTTNHIHKYFKKSSIIVSTAFDEGFGRTLIEGMSLSKPVIAFDTGGPKEIIIDNSNGFLIPKIDEKKFDSKILELYNNPLKAKEFGRKSFDIFNKKFSSEKYISEHIKTFEKYL